jgi:hypothetical protein
VPADYRSGIFSPYADDNYDGDANFVPQWGQNLAPGGVF